MSNNIPAWQFNTIPGNAVQGSILLTRRDIGNPPFNQSDFTWYPMEDVVGIANIKLEYDQSSNYFKLYKAKGHINNKKKWTYEWEFVGEWKDIGFTPTEAQLIAMNSGIDGIKVEQIELNKEAINQLNSSKADKATTYDKTEVDTLLTNKQDKIEDTTEQTITDNDYLSDLNNTANKRYSISAIWNYIKGKITQIYYPIGSVVFNMGTNPSTNYGGTWELLADGTKALYLDSTAGTIINEELPNIKGEIGNMFIKGDRRTFTKSGALDFENSNNNYGGTTSQSGTVLIGIKFNAYNSNSVYKDNGKVRAEGITICAWKRTA